MPRPNPLERGPKPGSSKATQRPDKPVPNRDSKAKRDLPSRHSNYGGSNRNRGRRGNGGRGSGQNQSPEPQPSETQPWLLTELGILSELNFEPDPSASFVEYLRWMRSPNHPYEVSAKLQIMQLAQEKADYESILDRLTKRIAAIVATRNGECFEAEVSWRVRVGGHRGPESTLLPAFDSLGMPYIPSCTLRGVARTQAIQEQLPSNLDYSDKKVIEKAWKKADAEVAQWFGHLDATDSERTGRVIFLDAYPCPSMTGGLSLDMVNNVWQKKNVGESPEYKPNPNLFFSLGKTKFQIALCPLSQSQQDRKAFDKVKKWLIDGLRLGIGSQINTGYGRLLPSGDDTAVSQELLKVQFHLAGQLIHGQQEFSDLQQPYKWNHRDQEWKTTGREQKYDPDRIGIPETRPTAFKAILRYWFRAFASGVAPIPDVLDHWEPKLFGAIQPQQRGWIVFQITDSKEPRRIIQEKGQPCLQQSGILRLSYSTEAPKCLEKRNHIKTLFRHLIWLMFHLGGVGQGARRPLYCRENRPPNKPPWYRGTQLKANPDQLFPELPATVDEFKSLFQEHLEKFYEALGSVFDAKVTPKNLFARNLQTGQWQDSVDENCRILVCSGESDNGKPYALAVLHREDLKILKKKHGKTIRINDKPELEYDPTLCGESGDRSPIWITHLGEYPDLDGYQVVTVFGKAIPKRQKFIQLLQSSEEPQVEACTQLFPMN